MSNSSEEDLHLKRERTLETPELYDNLAKQAREAGLDDLADRFLSHSLELKRRRAAEQLIEETIAAIPDKMANLLHFGHSGSRTLLYGLGIEGGEASERIASQIFEVMETRDPRASKEAGPISSADGDELYEVRTTHGVALRVSRSPEMEGTRYFDIWAIKQ